MGQYWTSDNTAWQTYSASNTVNTVIWTQPTYSGSGVVSAGDIVITPARVENPSPEDELAWLARRIDEVVAKSGIAA